MVTSHSKDLSIPGERIGYIAVHPEAEDGENIINGAILCTRILGFVNAPALMQRTAGELIGVSIDPGVYQRKRDLLCDGLQSCGYEFTVPKGTFYLLRKRRGVTSSHLSRRCSGSAFSLFREKDSASPDTFALPSVLMIQR